MQITKIIPSMVENGITHSKKINEILIQIWKVDHYFLSTYLYFTNSDFVMLIYVFPIAGNYFSLNCLNRLGLNLILFSKTPNRDSQSDEVFIIHTVY